MMPQSKDWLELTPQESLEITLNYCLELAKKVKKRPRYSTQLVLAIHNLFHISMIGAFRYCQEDKYVKSARKDFVKFLNSSGGVPYPEKLRLLDFVELSKGGRRKKLFDFSDNDLDQIKRLHELRNDLIHYEGTTWSISQASLRYWLTETVPVMEKILRTGFSHWGLISWWKAKDVMGEVDNVEKWKRTIFKKLQALTRFCSEL